MGSTGHPRNNHFYDRCRLCGCLVSCKDGSQSLRYQANSSWHARYLWLRLSFRPIPSWTNDDHVSTEQLTCLKGTYFSPTHNSYSHRLQVLFATNTFHACLKNLYEFTKYTENLNHIKLQMLSLIQIFCALISLLKSLILSDFSPLLASFDICVSSLAKSKPSPGQFRSS